MRAAVFCLALAAPTLAFAQDAGAPDWFGSGNVRPLPTCDELARRPPPGNAGMCRGSVGTKPPKGMKSFGMRGLIGKDSSAPDAGVKPTGAP